MTVVDKIQAGIFQMNAPSIDPLTSKRILVYGPEGVGKSTLVAGVKNAAVIDTEGSQSGFKVLRADATDWPKSVEAVGFVAQHAPGKVDVVIVDSLPQMYAHCRDYVLDREGWVTEKDGGPFGAGYAVVREEFRPVLKQLFDLHEHHGIGLIFVTHEYSETIETDAGDYTVVKPILPDDGDKPHHLGKIIRGVFDGIWRYNVRGMDDPQHVLTTARDGVFTAKDRTARMPAELVIPKLTSPDPSQRAKDAWAYIQKAYEGDQ